MLAQKDVAATIAVQDLGRAREFYSDMLGFEELASDPDVYVSYKSGETNFLVYKSQYAGGYEATVVTWSADKDVDNIVKHL
ncbi:MAG: VOC family protein [Alphaproteobacteria bacterium]